VANSIRIHVGLLAYQIESSSRGPGGPGGPSGKALPVNEARALLRRVHDGRNKQRLRAFTSALCRSTLEWDDDPCVIDDLLRTGRLRVRLVETHAVEAPIAPTSEPIENEIAEAHTVEIELLDADDNPVPGEPYRIELPDGTIRSGTLDGRGRARIAGITQAGNCQVCFYERDAAAWEAS
jgi:translation initiation factor IF-1